MTSTTHVHYHVTAVQDWGGSQEYEVVWNDELDLTAARRLADNMVRADTWFHQIDPFAAIGEYGVDRLRDLVHQRRSRLGSRLACPLRRPAVPVPGNKKSHSNTFGEPYWTAQPAMKGLR
jgi:hypothetical protein